MSNNKHYMREYMRRRHTEKRAEYVERFGGKCVKCGSDEDLQFDHIDTKTKTASMGTIWSRSRERIEAEVSKCQLLCGPCHVLKTLAERGKKPAVGTHGTLSSYRYCKCDVCKAASSEHNKKYTAKRVASGWVRPSRGSGPRKSVRGTHGTISAYRYCHCDLCKEARRIYSKDYYHRKKAEK